MMATTFVLPLRSCDDAEAWCRYNLPATGWIRKAHRFSVSRASDERDNEYKNWTGSEWKRFMADQIAKRNECLRNASNGIWPSQTVPTKTFTIYDDADALAFKLMFGGETV